MSRDTDCCEYEASKRQQQCAKQVVLTDDYDGGGAENLEREDQWN